MDSDEETFLLALLLLRRRRRHRRKRVWMNSLTSERLTLGQYHMTMNELKADNDKFFNYFRMSQDTFNQLLTLLKIHIQRANTNMRRSISAEERLSITLRYLASGCSFTDLYHEFRCGISTIREIVIDVCDKIWHILHNICFPELIQKEWLKIAEGFETQANFPNCIGAIDVKHVKYIYKKHSLDLLAVCDSNYRFTYIDLGSYSKESESSIYKNSLLFKKIEENTLNLPNNRPVSVDGDPLPFTFIGDEAFDLSTHMLRPYRGRNLTQEKEHFNYRLSKARHYIEGAFGILTNKWHIFHRPLDVDVKVAEAIIKGCCTLHNFVRERDGINFDDTQNVIGLDEGEGVAVIQPPGAQSALTTKGKYAEYLGESEAVIQTPGAQSALTIRGKFAEYFSNEGSDPLIS